MCVCVCGKFVRRASFTITSRIGHRCGNDTQMCLVLLLFFLDSLNGEFREYPIYNGGEFGYGEKHFQMASARPFFFSFFKRE